MTRGLYQARSGGRPAVAPPRRVTNNWPSKTSPVGILFSFTVNTTGLRYRDADAEKGPRGAHVTFVNSNGAVTIAGTTTKARTHHLTIMVSNRKHRAGSSR